MTGLRGSLLAIAGGPVNTSFVPSLARMIRAIGVPVRNLLRHAS